MPRASNRTPGSYAQALSALCTIGIMSVRHMQKHYAIYDSLHYALCTTPGSNARALSTQAPRYTGENTLCYRDGLLSKMTPASVLIYAKSTFDSWQCAMNFTILFLSVAIVTFGNLALCLLIIQSPLSCLVVGGGHDGAHDRNPGT